MSWTRVRGHPEAKTLFRTAFERGRLGQAYLLVGPEGIGKRHFATELARALLCERRTNTLEACGACPACTQVEAKTHPDLLILSTPEGKHELPVAEMRNFCARLARKPARGGYKVGIVIDADDFNTESANSFLKVLEEPPPGVILLLIATSTQRQLSTILSRCQIVRLNPLTPADLVAILAEHRIEDHARCEQLARLANGSVSRALALNDEAIWNVRNEILTGLAAARPNFSRLSETWTKFVEDAGKDTAAQRGRASVVIGFVVDLLRHALRIALGAQTRPLDPTEAARLEALAARLGPDRLVALIEKCIEADYRVERRVQLILVIESVLEQLTHTSQ